MADALHARRRLAALAAVAALVVALYLTIDLGGNLAFVLALRGIRLVALIAVAAAVALATVLFQTLTGNRILTPGIMGLDALYGVTQAGLILLLGGLGFAALDPRLKFFADLAVMMALALALFLPLVGGRRDMALMLLTGVVFGLLFRSLTQLIGRLIDPNAFAYVQAASFADFNTVRADLVGVGLAITAAAAAVAWRARHQLDVLALGRDRATGLGLTVPPLVAGLLLLVALLTAVSTALVGPIAFLGLIVVALAERVVGTRRHGLLLPAAVLTAVVVLVGGQTLLQHGLNGAATLGVVVDAVGGVVFLFLLLGSRSR